MLDIVRNVFNVQIADLQQIKSNDTYVFRAISDEEKVFIIKLYKQKNIELVEKIALNHDFLHFLSQKIQLPLQTSLHKNFPLIEFQGEKRYLVLLNWVEGENIETKDNAFAERLGSLMAKMHNASEEWKVESRKWKVEEKAFLSIDYQLIKNVKKLILNKKDVFDIDEKKLDDCFEKIKNIYKKHKKTSKNFGLIHSDLHFGNLLIKDGELYPIDFDEVAFGHYLLDIAVIYQEFEDYDDHKTLKKHYKKGYEKYRNLGENFDKNVVDFQLIASALYLNWLFAKGNEELLFEKKYIGFAKKLLEKMLNF